MGIPLYRHRDTALVRATTTPLSALPDVWPDLADADSCRAWITEHYTTDLDAAIEHASPQLAANVAAVRAGADTLPSRRVRSTTRSVLRYLLRATGRPTPNGEFAGVAPADFGENTKLRLADARRTFARPDAEWLAAIITRFEQSDTVLPHLRVATSNLVTQQGERLHIPHGINRVSLPLTRALACVVRCASSPITVEKLIARLTTDFPHGSREAALTMIASLVDQGFLISHLRAPSTFTDPLGYLTTALLHLPAIDAHPGVSGLLADLLAIGEDLTRHNTGPFVQHSAVRADLTTRMRRHTSAGRSPLSLDVALDCSLTLPRSLADDLDRAAAALLRLSRHPHGEPVWLDYHRRFRDRYGDGTLVPLTDVLNPGAGLGYPAGYPGSILPAPMQAASPRDGRLLALACRALVDGSHEIALTDDDLTEIAGDVSVNPPPHVELVVRVHAADTDAIDRGDYRLTVTPGRSVGTLTGRHTHAVPDLADLYGDLPPATEGATRAQLTFAPAYPVAENISRVPAHLDHLLPLGEHHPEHLTAAPDYINVADLCLTATRERLHLVDPRHGVIEPQVFHALALDTQPAPLIRYVAQLPRAFNTAWTYLDWGPTAADLPLLPRVRYGRVTLASARWRLGSADLPQRLHSDAACIVLDAWRLRWRCPALVDLRNAARTLRLDLTVPAHVALLRDHLNQRGSVTLTEAIPADDLGWIGRAHEVVVPLTSTGEPAPAPPIATAPLVVNRNHGQLPAAPDARWISVAIYTHPELMDEVIRFHLPVLVAHLDEPPAWWFIRYRSTHETDHLRLRLRTPYTDGSGATIGAITEWIDELRHQGITSRATFDAYYPEVGRYGDGDALDAAESVFSADSLAVQRDLMDLTETTPRVALAAAGMVHLLRGLLGDAAWAWLIDHKPVMQAASRAPLDRDLAEHVRRLSLTDTYPTGWAPERAEAWRARARALRHYAGQLPYPVPASVVESLLHMHHNRVFGPDRTSEHHARRLARHVALTARAHASPVSHP